MATAVASIQAYILHPDQQGSHLCQLAETMAEGEPTKYRTDTAESCQERLERAAENIARFVYLVWGPVGPEEYAPRTYEMLMGLQRRMRGMPPHTAWEYALSALGDDIRQRLRKAGGITIDPDMETALTHRFFDNLEEHNYLHDVAHKVMDLHWLRRHGPEAITGEEVGRSGKVTGPRGQAEMEKHLERLAREALATYIEQANIGWGNIDNPSDPTIVLRDRIEIQLTLGAKSSDTWEASAGRLADQIERRFGTTAARKEARAARIGWGAMEHPRGVGPSHPAPAGEAEG
jgi:hypothetical protein